MCWRTRILPTRAQTARNATPITMFIISSGMVRHPRMKKSVRAESVFFDPRSLRAG